MSDQYLEHLDALWETDREEYYRRLVGIVESLQMAGVLDASDLTDIKAEQRAFSEMQGDVRERRDGAELDEENEH